MRVSRSSAIAMCSISQVRMEGTWAFCYTSIVFKVIPRNAAICLHIGRWQMPEFPCLWWEFFFFVRLSRIHTSLKNWSKRTSANPHHCDECGNRHGFSRCKLVTRPTWPHNGYCVPTYITLRAKRINITIYVFNTLWLWGWNGFAVNCFMVELGRKNTNY